VTFFGLKHNTFFEDVLVEKVEIVNEGIRYTRNGEKYIVIDPGANTFQIEYTITPDNAVNKNVRFVVDEQQTTATVDENGLVTFNDIGSVIVYVVADDSSGAKDYIEITKLR
jgi:hypothetical protein